MSDRISSITQGLQELVSKWMQETERLHNITPDERDRDSRRDGLLEAVADIVAFTAQFNCGFPLSKSEWLIDRIEQLWAEHVSDGWSGDYFCVDDRFKEALIKELRVASHE